MPQGFRGAASISVERARPRRFDYEGEARPHVCVQMYGMFHDYSSIPNVCRQIAYGLAGAAGSVALHSYTGGPRFEHEPAAARGIDPDAPIGFFYGIPEAVGGPVMAHATRIIGLACETDRIPTSWVRCCNAFDLAVVPSRYCRESLRCSGVDVPILVVPHGLEPCYRPVARKRRSRPFVFYNVLNAQLPRRKGLPELLRAFRRAFPDRSDVVLELRVARSFPVRQVFAEVAGAADDARIRVDERMDLPTGEFAAHYSQVHCTVHPSMSEGFGLVPFQSIASETPVIAPCSTGMAEYLDASNAMVLRNRDTCRTPDVYYGAGTYPGIDEEHLVELLRHAEANWESEYERVRGAGPAFRERHAWPNALAGLLALVRDLCATDDAAARRALIRERVRD